MRRFGVIAGALLVGVIAVFAELDTAALSRDHPAIRYSTRPTSDPVAQLNRKIRDGAVSLVFDGPSGYLKSILKELNVPVESQMAVFSKTSRQLGLIEPHNPRTIFFNDSVVVAWMRGGFVELASLDPEQGAVFYTLEQQRRDNPQFIRHDDCLSCHQSEATLGIPGMMVRSMFTSPDGSPWLVLGGYTTDHRSPFEERWGGWYVTGNLGSLSHMGNTMINEPDAPDSTKVRQPSDIKSLNEKFDTTGYLTPYSDVAALLVFNHQMQMINLITRMGWESRIGLDGNSAEQGNLAQTARELVDYMLFIDETPIPAKLRGNSGFAEKFAALGPFDHQGRSLRQLALHRRLMQYPCSYMIYSDAFNALPARAKEALYGRMWQILSGRETGRKYAKLSSVDRETIVEILRDTKKDLPAYFRPVTN